MNPIQQSDDGELLATFARTGSQPAFAEIVRRHGAMVHGVALRVLGDHHEAQDVAQAVFLTLASKARCLRQDPSLTGWLHRVTVCAARDVRTSRQRRQQREDRAMSENTAVESAAVDQGLFREELDAAIDRLPDRYRRPLTEFHLQGKSLEETAKLLGLNVSATSVRLVRARELLRKTLLRRGITVGSVGALTALLSAESGAAVLPATFVASTVGAATGGAVSTTVATLTKGTLQMIFWSKVKLVAAIAAASVLVTGTGVVVAGKVATVGSSTNADMNTKLLVGEGMKRLRDQKPLEAISLFEQAQTSAADDELRAEIWYWLGEAHQRAGKGDEATRCWKEMTSQYPTAKWSKYARGRLASGGGMKDPGQTVERAELPAVPKPDSGKVFKSIDTARPGFYVDGKWSYSYTIAREGPQPGYRQGFLKYDSRDLLNPGPGDFIKTPWGWMQWQDRQPAAGNWLPVAEKPAKGKQLPDPASDPSIVSRPPPAP